MGVRIGYGFDASDLSAENMVAFMAREMPAEELLGDLIACGKAHWNNGQTDYEATEG